MFWESSVYWNKGFIATGIWKGWAILTISILVSNTEVLENVINAELNTVNVVILRKCLQDLSRGGYFHNTTPISLIKLYKKGP